MRKMEEERRKEEERRRKEEEAALLRAGLRRPARRVIGAISDEWRLKVMRTVEARAGVELAKSPEGSALLSKDFVTVVPEREWLNDEIVNGSLLHLANYINAQAGIRDVKAQTPKCQAFTSFFWSQLSQRGAQGTQRWMRRVGVTRDNFLDIDTVLMPICKSDHWTLVVVRPTRRTVAHVDSMSPDGGGRPEVASTAFEWVKGVLGERWTGDCRVVSYRTPRQTNGWDCGVHTVTNAMFLALGLDPACYGAPEMPLQRYRIAATLLNGGFFGDFDLGGF